MHSPIEASHNSSGDILGVAAIDEVVKVWIPWVGATVLRQLETGDAKVAWRAGLKRQQYASHDAKEERHSLTARISEEEMHCRIASALAQNT